MLNNHARHISYNYIGLDGNTYPSSDATAWSTNCVAAIALTSDTTTIGGFSTNITYNMVDFPKYEYLATLTNDSTVGFYIKFAENFQDSTAAVDPSFIEGSSFVLQPTSALLGGKVTLPVEGLFNGLGCVIDITNYTAGSSDSTDVSMYIMLKERY